jgi:hypothetical protein
LLQNVHWWVDGELVAVDMEVNTHELLMQNSAGRTEENQEKHYRTGRCFGNALNYLRIVLGSNLRAELQLRWLRFFVAFLSPFRQVP